MFSNSSTKNVQYDHSVNEAEVPLYYEMARFSLLICNVSVQNLDGNERPVSLVVKHPVNRKAPLQNSLISKNSSPQCIRHIFEWVNVFAQMLGFHYPFLSVVIDSSYSKPQE